MGVNVQRTGRPAVESTDVEPVDRSPGNPIKVGGGSVNFPRDAKTRSRALTPAASDTVREVTSRLKGTTRRNRMGHTDTDRT